jgi:hypothetical protein
MPIGMIAGGLIGAIGLGVLASRSDTEPPPPTDAGQPARLN